MSSNPAKPRVRTRTRTKPLPLPGGEKLTLADLDWDSQYFVYDRRAKVVTLMAVTAYTAKKLLRVATPYSTWFLFPDDPLPQRVKVLHKAPGKPLSPVPERKTTVRCRYLRRKLKKAESSERQSIPVI